MRVILEDISVLTNEESKQSVEVVYEGENEGGIPRQPVFI
jgi:hypothetical protein